MVGRRLGFLTFFFLLFSCIVYLTLMSRRTREPLHTIISWRHISFVSPAISLSERRLYKHHISYSRFVSPAGVGGFDGRILRVVSWTDSFTIHENSITQE